MYAVPGRFSKLTSRILPLEHVRYFFLSFVFTSHFFFALEVNSTMLSQSLVSSIVEAVAQRLQQRSALSLPRRAALPFQNISPDSIVTLNDVANMPPQRMQLVDSTTARSSEEEVLRRSSSDISDRTTLSLCAELDTGAFAASYDEIIPINRGSKKKLYLSRDKSAVNGEIMKALDAVYLAPYTSPIFRRFYKQSDPTTLKTNADIVFEEFKKLAKNPVRRACANSNTNEPYLEQRYFWCAYDLVRKRRANHIQSWRMHGRPSNFCYGGQELYEATYGKITGFAKKKQTKTQEKNTAEENIKCR